MALIPPFFINSVVAIGLPADPDPEWIGTGFLYGLPAKRQQDGYYLFLVTNKHVFGEEAKVVVRFNGEAGQSAIDFPLNLKSKNGRPYWVGHSNKTIDVAALPIDPRPLKSSGREVKFFASDTAAANRQKLRDMGASEGDGVFVLGFPMGIVGADRQYAICRSGCIARIQDMLSGSDAFLVDAFVFPGNSGGPVISQPEVMAIEGTKTSDTAYLIGMVRTYLAYEDVAYSKQTNMERVTFQENSGLTEVIPVDRIHETVLLCRSRTTRRGASRRSRAKKAKVQSPAT